MFLVDENIVTHVWKLRSHHNLPTNISVFLLFFFKKKETRRLEDINKFQKYFSAEQRKVS